MFSEENPEYLSVTFSLFVYSMVVGVLYLSASTVTVQDFHQLQTYENPLITPAVYDGQ